MQIGKTLVLPFIFAILPWPVFALDTGAVTVNFTSARGFDERATSTFLNTRDKEVVLPLRYAARDFGVGLRASFGREAITAVGAGGGLVLVGSGGGGLARINSQGTAEILTDYVPKAKKINGIGFMSEKNLWVIGGEANDRQGAMLYTLSGITTEDFQEQAKEIGLDRIDEIACIENMCLLYGVRGFSAKQIARFDGVSLTDITATFAFSTAVPWQVAAGDGALAVAGLYKDIAPGAPEPHIIRVYVWSAGVWRQITNDNLLKSAREARVDLGWTGQEWILARQGSSAQSAKVWAFNNTAFSEITPRFSRARDKMVFNPIVFGVDNIYYIGGASSLLASLGQGVELSAGYVRELNGIQVYGLADFGGKILIAGKLAGLPALYEIALEGFMPSAAAQTEKLASAASGKYFKKATLRASAEIATNTRIEYLLSADGGAHFETVLAGQAHEFTAVGDDLRFRAVLISDNAAETPRLKQITIEFEKSEIETEAAKRRRDNTRKSDLDKVGRALEKFKSARGVYPIVDARSAETRFELLGRFLIDGKYIAEMPKDPKHSEDPNLVYDYIVNESGGAYLLRARFEEAGSKRLNDDVDGQPVAEHKYEYTCDDPWYCQGQGPGIDHDQAAGRHGLATSGSDRDLFTSDDGKIWRIASIGGAGEIIEQRKLYIPSQSLLKKLKGFYGKMRRIGQAEIDQIPRAKLVKAADKPDVYYITETFLKRPFLNWNAFVSYGNKTKDIVIIKAEEIAEYGDSNLVRLSGDKKVWFIENGALRHVANPSVMKKYGFKWENIAPVNSTELNSYKTGEPLE